MGKTICRFKKILTTSNIDPLSNKYPGWSLYNYCLNNPIHKIDPNGKELQVDTGEKDENGNAIKYTYQNGSFYKNGQLVKKNIGMKKFFSGTYSGFLGQVYKAIQKIESGGKDGNQLINDLVSDKNKVYTKIETNKALNMWQQVAQFIGIATKVALLLAIIIKRFHFHLKLLWHMS